MSNNIFNKVLQPKVRESKFNLSHDKKLSFDMGELVPTCVFDVLPGDRFNINVESMLRFAPLISPVMHKIKVITNFFFVPNRILWDGWEDFITNTDDTLIPPVIRVQDSGTYYTPGTLGDYIGYPEGGVNNSQETVSAFPLAAYVSIHDYWYRDENLQPEQFVALASGVNASYEPFASGKCLYRNHNHDYLSSALPFAQKGDAVSIPLLGTNVEVNQDNPGVTGKALDATTFANATGDWASNAQGEFTVATNDAVYDPNGTLEVEQELSTIENLRKAFRLQEFLEKNARGGTRYSEHLKSHFDVRAHDSRLNNPEYIGGHTQT